MKVYTNQSHLIFYKGKRNRVHRFSLIGRILVKLRQTGEMLSTISVIERQQTNTTIIKLFRPQLEELYAHLVFFLSVNFDRPINLT